MKVRCLRKGFDGLSIREPGDIFELPDDTPPWKPRPQTPAEEAQGLQPGPWWEKVVDEPEEE